ncbi:serine/threonine-protein kinase MPS1 [Athalia rosae]|uniref:serine/threonine-protein kinase MPS1 n=1 Tax=Athalia rosae TaxID=37344 RepID=UPI0020337553|nr:serine/threonine-protein kinase MPS1 [Athalia rosae]
MSEINDQQGDVSLDERNNTTGNSGLHNLTGPRARFQPVRMKALLDLFESEEDDTEPRDSDNDSDSESLQPLPDDEFDNLNCVTENVDESFRNGKPLPSESDHKVLENQTETSIKNLGLDDRISNNYQAINSPQPMPLESVQNSFQISSKNKPDCLSIISSSNHNKVTQQAPNNLNSWDSYQKPIFTSQTLINPIDKKPYAQNVITTNKSEASNQQQELMSSIDSDYPHISNSAPRYSGNPIQSEGLLGPIQQEVSYVAPLQSSVTATPLKHPTISAGHPNPCHSRRDIMETPQTKSFQSSSQNNVETPGLIFSHWSKNNFFQTPTQKQILTKKHGVGGRGGPALQDLGLQPHRFCTSESKSIRRPLSEAMYLNRGSSIAASPNNHAVEYRSFERNSSHISSGLESLYSMKTNSLSKENRVVDTKLDIKNYTVKKIVQSLQESNHQQQGSKQENSRALLNNDIKVDSKTNTNGRNGIASDIPVVPAFVSSKEQGFEMRATKNSESNFRIDSTNSSVNKDACGNNLNTEGQVNARNNYYGIKSLNGADISKSLPKPDLPLPVNRDTPSTLQNTKSNQGNVQFSLASKDSDRKHGKTITVKGSGYLVLGKLGQGMSGEVLRVQDVKTGELRAIKCVDLSCIDRETAQGCLEEVSLLDKLRAPCIIDMINYEIQSNLLYVVMEMGDTDLSKLLKSMSREKQLPLTMILYYWTEMLTAVKHIHDNGVIHSDLKPANFLLVRGRLKLIDFGIASTVNADMTSVVKNTSLGTVNYISPEAIIDVGGNGDSPNDNNKYKIHFKSDVWSLGCILYSLVYGQTPFQHIRANWAKIAEITNPNQKIAFPPMEIMSRRGYSSPPPFLVDVMRRCLQHDRKARPTVDQLLQIPYVGCNCPPISNLPSISASILSKIKQSLEENEWRQLLEVLERRKPLC